MKGCEGFTFVEVMMVATIIALVAAIAVPNHLYTKEAALFSACVRNRQTIEWAEGQYVLDNDHHSSGVTTELVEKGYLGNATICPSGGLYYWVAYPPDDHRYHTVVGCSIHGPNKMVNVNIAALAEDPPE
jgi:general secretion pathway protein G